MAATDGPAGESDFRSLQLKKLRLEHVRRIDEILASLGEYGEVHLIVQRGELRYINKVESFKAWKADKEK